MSLFNSAFENFKEKFRKIEKLSRKCVNLQGAIVYIVILIKLTDFFNFYGWIRTMKKISLF